MDNRGQQDQQSLGSTIRICVNGDVKMIEQEKGKAEMEN